MRKPNAGMLLSAAIDHGIDLSQSWMIGDRMTDVEAGHRAGARSILLEGPDRPEHEEYEPPIAYVKNLFEASQFISNFKI